MQCNAEETYPDPMRIRTILRPWLSLPIPSQFLFTFFRQIVETRDQNIIYTFFVSAHCIIIFTQLLQTHRETHHDPDIPHHALKCNIETDAKLLWTRWDEGENCM